MTTCIHHWRLEDATRNVPGVCVKCGAERVFAGFTEQDVLGSPFSMKARQFDPEKHKASVERGRSKKVKPDGNFTHGTSYGYRRRYCRCELCKEWSHKVQAERWAKKKGAAA